MRKRYRQSVNIAFIFILYCTASRVEGLLNNEAMYCSCSGLFRKTISMLQYNIILYNTIISFYWFFAVNSELKLCCCTWRNTDLFASNYKFGTSQIFRLVFDKFLSIEICIHGIYAEFNGSSTVLQILLEIWYRHSHAFSVSW